MWSRERGRRIGLCHRERSGRLKPTRTGQHTAREERGRERASGTGSSVCPGPAHGQHWASEAHGRPVWLKGDRQANLPTWCVGTVPGRPGVPRSLPTGWARYFKVTLIMSKREVTSRSAQRAGADGARAACGSRRRCCTGRAAPEPRAQVPSPLHEGSGGVGGRAFPGVHRY